jgi:hypothetical protein
LFPKDGEESRRSSSRFLEEGEPGVDMSFVINKEASTPKGIFDASDHLRQRNVKKDHL